MSVAMHARMQKLPSRTGSVSPLSMTQIPAVLDAVSDLHNPLFLSRSPSAAYAAIAAWCRKRHFDVIDASGLALENCTPQARAQGATPSEALLALSKESNPEGRKTLVCLGNIHALADALQPVLVRLLNDRAIGRVSIRENVIFAAVADPAPIDSDQLFGRRDFIKNSFLVLPVETDLPSWVTENHLAPAAWVKLFNVLQKVSNLKIATRSSLVDAITSALPHPDIGAISTPVGSPEGEQLLEQPDIAALPAASDTLSSTVPMIVRRALLNPARYVLPALHVAYRLVREHSIWGVYMLNLMSKNKPLWDYVMGEGFYVQRLFPAIAEDRNLMASLFQWTRANERRARLALAA